jgi:hypothetical protein
MTMNNEKKTKIKCSYYLQESTEKKIFELYLNYCMNDYKNKISKSEIVERAINLLYETTITKQ